MGLLDGFGFDPNDPRKAAMMAAAAELMMGGRNLGQAAGRGLLSGMQAYQATGLLGDRRAQEAQEREVRQAELDQRRAMLAREGKIDQLAQSAFGTNPNLVSGDDEGNAMPQAPGGGGMPEFTRGLMGIAPMQAIGLMQQQRPKYHNVGNALVPEPRIPGETVSPVYQAPPPLPTGMRMGANGPEWIPNYVEGQGQIRAAGRPQTNVNLPPGQKAFEVETAKLDAKQLDEWREAATKAQGGLSRIQEMKALAQGGTYSGWGASGRAGVANFFSTLGVPFDTTKLENSQQYTKHAKELTLAMLKEGVGSTNISNADLAFVNETVPQLETNPRARLALLDYMERRLGTSVDRFQRADSYAREKGGLGGFKFEQAREPKREAPRNLTKNMTALVQARQAIKAGKKRDAVIQHLRENGFDPEGL